MTANGLIRLVVLLATIYANRAVDVSWWEYMDQKYLGKMFPGSNDTICVVHNRNGWNAPDDRETIERLNASDASVQNCLTSFAPISTENCVYLESKRRQRRLYGQWSSTNYTNLHAFLGSVFSSSEIADVLAPMVASSASSMLEVARTTEWNLTTCAIDVGEVQYMLDTAVNSLLTVRICHANLSETSSDMWADLPETVALDLSYNKIREVQNRTFEHIEAHLYFLDLSYNSISHLEQGAFTNMPHLCALSLSGNVLTTLESGVLRSPTLRFLGLHSNRIQRFGSEALAFVPSVVSLDFQHNDLGVSLSENIVEANGEFAVNASAWLGGLRFEESIVSEASGLMDTLSYANTLDLAANGMSYFNRNASLGHGNVKFIGVGRIEYVSILLNGFSAVTSELFDDDARSCLLFFNASGNDIAGVSDGAFAGFGRLMMLELSKNSITSLHPGMFDGLEDTLLLLNLAYNPIRYVRAHTFASGFPELLWLTLANNNFVCVYAYDRGDFPDRETGISCSLGASSDDAMEGHGGGNVNDDGAGSYHMTLESNAFNGLTNPKLDLNFAFSSVIDLPPYVFNGTGFKELNMRGHFVRSFSDYSFSGHTNLNRIDLRGSCFENLSPRSFEGLHSLEPNECEDRKGFLLYFRDEYGGCANVTIAKDQIRCPTLPLTCATLAEAAEIDILILKHLEGENGATAAESCCFLGGGMKDGKHALLMDGSAPVSCRAVLDDDNNESFVQCGCNLRSRFDAIQRTCLSRCNSGEFWSQEASDINQTTIKDSTICGKCRKCPFGRFSILNLENTDNVDENSDMYFPPTCDTCQPGRFSDSEGATSCSACPSNSYSASSASKCSSCAYGRFSDEASASCDGCPFAYVGSKHCDVPVLAIVLISIACIVVGVLLRAFLKYRTRQEMIKDQLATALMRQRKLAKAKSTDLELMAGAWKLEMSELRIIRKLGVGAQGSVYEAAFHEKWKCAVKKMQTGGFEDGASGDSTGSATKGSASLLNSQEIQFLMRTRHERLVMFLGAGVDPSDGHVFTVMEWMEGGSLDVLLWGESPIDWISRLQIIRDVTDGLMFLHIMHKSVHQDLKSPNVLLETRTDSTPTDERSGPKWRAKLGDFGLSRIVRHGKTRTRRSTITRTMTPAERRVRWEKRGESGYVGTPAWMAPELMNDSVAIGPAIDIFSFGVLMWEIWAQDRPWKGSERLAIFASVRKGLRPQVPISESPKGYKDLMCRCWHQQSNKRPTVDRVSESVTCILEERAKNIKRASEKYAQEVTIGISGKEEEKVAEAIADVHGIELTGALPSPRNSEAK